MADRHFIAFAIFIRQRHCQLRRSPPPPRLITCRQPLFHCRHAIAPLAAIMPCRHCAIDIIFSFLRCLSFAATLRPAADAAATALPRLITPAVFCRFSDCRLLRRVFASPLRQLPTPPFRRYAAAAMIADTPPRRRCRRRAAAFAAADFHAACITPPRRAETPIIDYFHYFRHFARYYHFDDCQYFAMPPFFRH